MRIAVLSDTHAPRRWKRCPTAVARELDTAELILHAGDVCTIDVLDQLAQFAPVVAVCGNNDGRDIADWGAGPTWTAEIGGVGLGLIHDSGPAAGRLPRMRRQFPVADLVIFGHSHIPFDVTELPTDRTPERDAASGDRSGRGLRIFNPGSPTDRRRQPHGTMGLFEVADGNLIFVRLIEVT